MSGAIDTSIPLRVNTGQNALTGGVEQAAQVGQMLGGLAGGVSGVKELQARMLAGQMLAHAPSIEAGLSSLEADPRTAPWTAQLQAQLAGIQQTMTGIASTKLAQGATMQHLAFKNILTAAADPSTLPDLLSNTLSTVPESLRPQAQKIFSGIEHSLLDGLPKDPQLAAAAYRARISGQFLSGGGTSDALSGFFGPVTMQNIGGQEVPVQMNPAYAGPGAAAGPGALARTLPPQLAGVPGGAQLPVGGAYGSGGPTPSGAQPPGAASGNAFDGRPLDPGNIPAESRPVGIGGIPVYTPAESARLAGSVAQFQSQAARDQFRNAQGSLQSLTMMTSDLNTLAKNGAFLQPGPGAQARTEFANTINTWGNILGAKAPIFDTKATAAAASFNKEMTRMGAQITNQFFGAGHEAWQTISSITSSVPGLENTPLASRLIIGSIQATAQRTIDERNFIRYVWMPKHYGNPDGGEEAFNKAHPAQGYAEGVLKTQGLTGESFKWKGPDGKTELQPKFTSPQAIIAQVHSGFLTGPEGSRYLMAQFPQDYQKMLNPTGAAPASSGGSP